MEDITPELLSKIKKAFKAAIEKNKKITVLYERIRDGTATYQEANEFAIEIGESLAEAFKNHLSADILPDGRMYYNIASRIIPETLQHNHELITEVAAKIQEDLNKRAGIGIKAIKPELNEDRIKGLVEKVSNAEDYNDVAWVLDEPIVNFSQSIVDDFIRENVEFQGAAGMRPKIIRTTVGKCCEWCEKLSGTYSYPNIRKDIYRRHERCRCIVTYDPDKGKDIQNVHTKRWQEREKIEARKKIGIIQEKKESPEARQQRVMRENGLSREAQRLAHPKIHR